MADKIDVQGNAVAIITKDHEDYIDLLSYHDVKHCCGEMSMPEEQESSSKYACRKYALAAPGPDGIIVGYNNYKHGQRIPSKNGGEFIKASQSPPKLNPVKMSALRAAWTKKYPKPEKVKWVPDASAKC